MTTDQQTHALTMTTPGDRELRFERTFAHPRERVWQAFTDPALIAQWWGGGTRVDHMDVRTGGSWRFVAERDKIYTFEGEYLEVDPPQRIVQTNRNPWNGLTTTETIEFEDLGGQTRLVQTSTFETTADRDAAVAQDAAAGAKYQFHQLEKLLGTLEGGK